MTALVLLAGCWFAAAVAFLVGCATAPLIDTMAGDRWAAGPAPGGEAVPALVLSIRAAIALGYEPSDIERQLLGGEA